MTEPTTPPPSGAPYGAPQYGNPNPNPMPSYGPPQQYGAPGYGYGGPMPFGTPPVQSAQAPQPVRTASVLCFVMAGFLLLGALVMLGVGAVASTISGAVAAILVVIGLVYLVGGGAQIWAGINMRRGNGTARTVALVFSWIIAALGLISLLGGQVLSLVSVGLAVAVIVMVQFNPQSKAFFNRG